jgi:hypothetical protein
MTVAGGVAGLEMEALATTGFAVVATPSPRTNSERIGKGRGLKMGNPDITSRD